MRFRAQGAYRLCSYNLGSHWSYNLAQFVRPPSTSINNRIVSFSNQLKLEFCILRCILAQFKSVLQLILLELWSAMCISNQFAAQGCLVDAISLHFCCSLLQFLVQSNYLYSYKPSLTVILVSSPVKSQNQTHIFPQLICGGIKPSNLEDHS